MRLAYIILVCITLLLGGCAGLGGYQSPAESTPHATIKGFNHETFASSRIVLVEKVDGKSLGGLFFQQSTIRLALGPHTITARAVIKTGFAKPQLSGRFNFQLNARQGNRYLVRAVLKNNTITAWIVDSRGKLVTPRKQISALPVGSQVVQVHTLPKN